MQDGGNGIGVPIASGGDIVLGQQPMARKGSSVKFFVAMGVALGIAGILAGIYFFVISPQLETKRAEIKPKIEDLIAEYESLRGAYDTVIGFTPDERHSTNNSDLLPFSGVGLTVFFEQLEVAEPRINELIGEIDNEVSANTFVFSSINEDWEDAKESVESTIYTMRKNTEGVIMVNESFVEMFYAQNKWPTKCSNYVTQEVRKISEKNASMKDVAERYGGVLCELIELYNNSRDASNSDDRLPDAFWARLAEAQRELIGALVVINVDGLGIRQLVDIRGSL